MTRVLLKLSIVAALTLTGTLAAMPLPAQAETARTILQAQGDGLSLSEAVEQVRRQYKGRIVSAETKRRGNREVHIIKVLTDDGKVKTVTIPGRNLGQRG